jgi:hypothetical protein
MIRKSGNRFSLATIAKRVCAVVMLKQGDEMMMRFHDCVVARRQRQISGVSCVPGETPTDNVVRL